MNKNFVSQIELVGLSPYPDHALPAYPPELSVLVSIRIEGKGTEEATLYTDPYPYVNGKWDIDWATQQWPLIDTKNILWDFLGLADESIETAHNKWKKFAERYGILRLCREHGLPFLHKGCCLYDPERWQDWLKLINQTKAMVDIGIALHKGEVGGQSSWKALHEGWDGNVPKSIEEADDHLSIMIDQYMEWGDIRPRLGWNRGKSCTQLRVASTFAHIAAGLLYFLSGDVGIATCMECGHFYGAKRAPRGDRANYCPDCSAQGVAARNYQRRKRRTKSDT